VEERASLKPGVAFQRAAEVCPLPFGHGFALLLDSGSS